MSTAKCILPIQSDDVSVEGGSACYVVSNHNRWSRAVLNFEGLDNDTWYELSFRLDWDPQEESQSAYDFAMVGFDFLMEDGSSIDFSYVPGLSRTQIDPHSCPVGGPGYYDQQSGHMQSGRVACTFYIPSPARKLSVTIRSWRNSHAFTIRDLKLLQQGSDILKNFNARRTWRSLSSDPLWFKYAIPTGRRLLIRGQVINESPASEGILARIVYLNARREILSPPYPDTIAAPSIGSFVDISVHHQARRFTLDLNPPPEATFIEIGFQTWNSQASMALVSPLEVSLEDDLLLENITGDDLPDALTFLKLLIEGPAPKGIAGVPEAKSSILKSLVDQGALDTLFTFDDKLKAVKVGKKSEVLSGRLSLGAFPAWPLPEELRWKEDPFQSLAWRLEFHSLSWIGHIAHEQGADSLTRAIDLAISWSLANPWGNPKDPISAHPLSLSARAGALLRLLSLSAKSQGTVPSRKVLFLLGEVLRHAFALAQIVSQNVFAHSIVHIHASCALLSLARALPKFSLSSHWTSLCLYHLQEGFNRFIDGNGAFVEQSQHYRLETITLGLILLRHLEDMPGTREFRADLTERLTKALRDIVAVTDPSGFLPPFGDTPPNQHHASWLRRLLSDYGSVLLLDPDLAAELSYPTGTKVFTSASSGLITARHYERDSKWSYFCSSFCDQRSEHGHFDCGSFIYSVGGTSWIVDPKGSEFYETGSARQHLVSSRAHNVAIPDGRAQAAGTGWLELHETLEGASVFQIGTNVYGPEYEHHRIMVCLDNLGAIAVFDHFSTLSRAISFEGLLHFDTGIITAIASPKLCINYHKNDRMRIIPHVIKGQFCGMGIENGRSDKPGVFQGFLARSDGKLNPANVLRYRFSGHGTVCGGVLLATDDQSASALSSLLKTKTVKDIFQRLQAEDQ